MSPLSLSLPENGDTTTISELLDENPTPATEKAIASLAPMLESFAPKTSAEDSASRLGSISSSPGVPATTSESVVEEVQPLTAENLGAGKSYSNLVSTFASAEGQRLNKTISIHQILQENHSHKQQIETLIMLPNYPKLVKLEFVPWTRKPCQNHVGKF